MPATGRALSADAVFRILDDKANHVVGRYAAHREGRFGLDDPVPMSEITTIGLLAKHVFQVHGVDAQGTIT